MWPWFLGALWNSQVLGYGLWGIRLFCLGLFLLIACILTLQTVGLEEGWQNLWARQLFWMIFLYCSVFWCIRTSVSLLSSCVLSCFLSFMKIFFYFLMLLCFYFSLMSEHTPTCVFFTFQNIFPFHMTVGRKRVPVNHWALEKEKPRLYPYPVVHLWICSYLFF